MAFTNMHCVIFVVISGDIALFADYDNRQLGCFSTENTEVPDITANGTDLERELLTSDDYEFRASFL